MNTDQTSPWSNLIWVHECLQKTCLIEKVGKEEKLLIAHLYFVYYVQQERHQLVWAIAAHPIYKHRFRETHFLSVKL